MNYSVHEMRARKQRTEVDPRLIRVSPAAAADDRIALQCRPIRRVYAGLAYGRVRVNFNARRT
jgi:hypothetical protein